MVQPVSADPPASRILPAPDPVGPMLKVVAAPPMERVVAVVLKMVEVVFEVVISPPVTKKSPPTPVTVVNVSERVILASPVGDSETLKSPARKSKVVAAEETVVSPSWIIKLTAEPHSHKTSVASQTSV